MYAVVEFRRLRGSLILTDVSNIDWTTKEIIDQSDLIENNHYLDDNIKVWDLRDKRVHMIKVKDIDTYNHRVIIKKKMYLALHLLTD